MISVGLVGIAGSGKDTAAKGLVQLGWRRVAFADKLKSFCIMLGWDGIKDRSGRTLLQEIGCAARNYNPHIWVYHVLKTLKKDEPCVFTDVRFQNEAALIKERGGILVRIVKPDLISDGHLSETEQQNIAVDYTILNSSTEEELQRKLVEILEKYK